MSTDQMTLILDALAPTWSERALQYVTRLAPGDELTSDSLRRILGEPRDPNELGALFRRCEKRGLLKYTGADLQSQRPQARGRWVRIWQRTER